jgi:GH24 family phage-related lysozyme (muramidase)
MFGFIARFLGGVALSFFVSKQTGVSFGGIAPRNYDFHITMFDEIYKQGVALARQNLILREGRRNVAYLDSVGKLTIGIGHLVKPQDNIRLGQRISDAQVDYFFNNDIATAAGAAKSQALELGKYNPDFLAALISVNFQLGTGWFKEFANTYKDLKSGNGAAAISRLNNSLWYSQTPTRVADFQSAIRRNFA